MIETTDHLRLDLAYVLIRFPENADQIRLIASKDAEFSEICEHYSLARATLNRFRSQSKDCLKAEVAEYTSLIADLEQEIWDFINREPEVLRHR